MARSSQRVLDVLGTAVRLGLAAVWLISGAFKASDPSQTYVSVQAYEVLPHAAVAIVAAGLPYLEMALGLLVLIGLGTRLVGAVSAVVLLAFIAGIVQAWARGLSIDCGCFGGGGQVADADTQYPLDLARDVGFLALAAWLLVRPYTLFSLDAVLHRGPIDLSESEPAGAGSPESPQQTRDDQLPDATNAPGPDLAGADTGRKDLREGR